MLERPVFKTEAGIVEFAGPETRDQEKRMLLVATGHLENVVRALILTASDLKMFVVGGWKEIDGAGVAFL